jgi:hypothetical protein
MSEPTELTAPIEADELVTSTYAAFNQRVLVNPTALRTTLAAETDKEKAKSKAKPDPAA